MARQVATQKNHTEVITTKSSVFRDKIRALSAAFRLYHSSRNVTLLLSLSLRTHVSGMMKHLFTHYNQNKKKLRFVYALFPIPARHFNMRRNKKIVVKKQHLGTLQSINV